MNHTRARASPRRPWPGRAVGVGVGEARRGAAADDVRAQLRRVPGPVDPRGGGAGPPRGTPARAGRVPAARGHLVPQAHGGTAAQHPRIAPAHGPLRGWW